VVATGGRLRRETNWVPLAKVQSVRWMQGPLQRRLDLATVRLDTAGRSIHTALKDRAADEAAAQLAALPGRCREARQLSG
jgi:putative membrane protein